MDEPSYSEIPAIQAGPGKLSNRWESRRSRAACPCDDRDPGFPGHAGLLRRGESPTPGSSRGGRSRVSSGKRLSDVRDIAKLFDEAAIATAHKELRRIEHETNVSTVIETVETLKGESIEKAAERLARHSGIQGIFILIAKKEHTIEILVSHRFQSAVTRARQDAIKDAFIADFRQREFNEGLKHGVAAIGKVLADASKAGELPKADIGRRVVRTWLLRSLHQSPSPRRWSSETEFD